MGVGTFLYRDGVIYGTESPTIDPTGRNCIFKINEAGATAQLTELTLTGSDSTENFASSQAIIGDKLFYVSSFKGNSSKRSVINVYAL